MVGSVTAERVEEGCLAEVKESMMGFPGQGMHCRADLEEGRVAWEVGGRMAGKCTRLPRRSEERLHRGGKALRGCQRSLFRS